MFNLSGTEIVVILLLALVVLGPEKLPEALRRAGRTYAELKKMGAGFQSEVRSAFEEPMNEMRETADMLRKAATFDDDDPAPAPVKSSAAPPARPVDDKPTLLLTDADAVTAEDRMADDPGVSDEPVAARGDLADDLDAIDAVDAVDAVSGDTDPGGSPAA